MKDYIFDPIHIMQRIDRLTDEQKSEYPRHYYDPVRIQIAQDLAIKEYYKLLPFLSEAQFEQMSSEMLDWFVGTDHELAPVHDYWNIVGSMTETHKLKPIIFYLTSANVHWELTEIDSKAISLRWGVGDLCGQEVKTGNWTYEEVKKAILDNPTRLAANKKISDDHSASSTTNRDHFPVIVLKDESGNYTLLDGNRRVMRAWLWDYANVRAWLGTIVTQPVLKDYWVSVSFLRRLLVEYSAQPSGDTLQSIHDQLKILFNQSVVARHHYIKRCMHIPGAQQAAADLV